MTLCYMRSTSKFREFKSHNVRQARGLSTDSSLSTKFKKRFQFAEVDGESCKPKWPKPESLAGPFKFHMGQYDDQKRYPSYEGCNS